MTTILDNSALASLAECETQAVVKYHLNRVPTKAKAEDAPREAGKAIHVGVAHVAQGGSIDGAMLLIKALYKPFADREVPQDDRRMLWPNVERCVKSYFRQWDGCYPFVTIPELVEIPFAVQIDDNLWFTGLIDGIVQDRVDHRYYVRELKTTGQKADWWMRQWRLASQVSHYTYCAPRAKKVIDVLGPGVEIAGTYIDKLDMSLLPSDPRRKCTGNNGHGTTFAECGHLHAQHVIQRFDRTPDQLLTWLQSAVILAGQWQAMCDAVRTLDDVRTNPVLQQGLFNGGCIFCDLNDWCATGRKNMHMLREERWAPIQPEALSA